MRDELSAKSSSSSDAPLSKAPVQPDHFGRTEDISSSRLLRLGFFATPGRILYRRSFVDGMFEDVTGRACDSNGTFSFA